MRDDLTEAEEKLWARLNSKQLGFKIRQQHPVYRYILDFYCDAKRLAIEIDGDIHKKQKEYDEHREKYLESIDIRTIRFSNDEVLNNIETVISKIKKELEK